VAYSELHNGGTVRQRFSPSPRCPGPIPILASSAAVEAGHAIDSSKKTPLILATAYGADNPMPEIMSTAVEDLGLPVRREPLRRALLRRYPSGTVPVIHLHWIGHLFRHRSVIVTSVRAAKYLALLTLAKLRRFKIVWTLHNVSSHGSRHKRIEKTVRELLIRSLTDAIIVMTQRSAADFEVRHGSAAAKKIHHVPHPTYSSFYPSALPKHEARQLFSLPLDVPIFLFFGRIRGYKDVASLARAFRALETDAFLVIAGASDPKDAQAIYEAAELDARIYVHLERVHDADVANLVAASDWVVLPYDDVSNSGVLLLALSFSRPVIAPDTPTLVEVLGPTLAQACYERGNDNSLHEALESAVGFHRDQAVWESRAESRAADFNARFCAEELADVYRSVASS